MQFGNFEEFWAALGRLYEASVNNTADIAELRTSTAELRESIAELRESTAELRDTSTRLLSAIEKHQGALESHERRLSRHDMTIDAILEDLRRHREGRSPQ